MILMDFSIFPLSEGVSVSPYVARAIDIVDRSGLAYRCHAMGTTIEGRLDQVLDVVRRCFEAMAADCERVECSIRMDYRRGDASRLSSKVAAVEQVLGRPVRK